jgi:hypothetical protein
MLSSSIFTLARMRLAFLFTASTSPAESMRSCTISLRASTFLSISAIFASSIIVIS